MEQVDLTEPITPPTTSNYHLSRMILDVDGSAIVVELLSNNNEKLTKIYNRSTVPTADTLLHNLNTGNFTTNSLLKAVYNRLIADGVLSGTVSGSPS